MKDLILDEINEHLSVAQSLLLITPQIEACVKICQQSLENGGRLFFAGNGGSAADAQHLAAEFVGRFQKERIPLPAIALTTNTSTLTAVANDYSYDRIFSRQLLGLGQEGDVFIGISTSGKSNNIVKACQIAQQKKIKSITFTGRTGGLLLAHSDICIRVDSSVTARIQEMHILIGHLLCKCIDEKY